MPLIVSGYITHVNVRMHVTCSYMHRTRWIKTNGQLYKPLNAVVTGIDEDYPQFGVIQNIYIANCKAFLEVMQYKTIIFFVTTMGMK